MTATLRRLEVETIRRLCPLVEVVTVTEWADRHRVLPETSTAPGPYRSSVVPYVRRWQDLLVDPSVSCVVLCWASQTTKSTVFENAIGYRIHRMPAPMLIVQPKIDAAEAWSKERFVPMVLATPVLRERVKLGKASDSTLRYKRFPGGFLFAASAQSATELAARSAPFVLLDEVDRFEYIPGEGNPVEIAARRQGAADIGLLALTSTPRDAETTIIWPYLEGGTYEFFHVPCPHCGEYQELVWGGPTAERGLKWPHGKPAEAEYLCAHCAALISEREKPGMLATGRWVPTQPDAPYPSSHLNALYSPFAKSSWGALATEWEKAQGKPADLQVFVNTRLAELWQEATQQLEASALTDRLEGFEENVVPAGAAVLTAGVDVQGNRLECYVWAWGPGLESWPVAFTMIPGDPAKLPEVPGSVWPQLDAFLATVFRHESGRPMRIVATLVDSGHATTTVYAYTNRRKGRKMYASKGIGGAGLAILGKPTLQTRQRVVLFPIGVDGAKTEFLRSQLVEVNVGAGYVHLPVWFTEDQREQLVAEKRVRRVVKGKVSYDWRLKRDGAPNEALDCRIYARAALLLPGMPASETYGQLAEAMAKPMAETAVKQAASGEATLPAALPKRPPRPGGWATGGGQWGVK